jgi:transcription elongation factor Elf1
MTEFEFSWKCPDCKCVNIADAIEAAKCTVSCGNCDGEFEVNFDINIMVTEIKKV